MKNILIIILSLIIIQCSTNKRAIYSEDKNLKFKLDTLSLFDQNRNRRIPIAIYQSKGYFVISIQHELKTDEFLAMTGKLQETRKPNWERGAKNILYVLQKIKKDYPQLKYNELTLIGHSNGGDMTALFVHQYPKLVSKIISMDNRRMELPRTSNPKIFTLRSKDYPADENVLPNNEELKKYNITVQFTNINHSSMDNDANETERNYLKMKILEYLKK
ncbi:alpha/beta hydrolase [Chryseobacterium sp. CFBP8996]|uniref:alpha/beta hydrolase n=1 Tax=Chryseobacterium sp. CFBP8996 TaxID=3096529 RepID=UPI002A6B37FC|nr:alpha/beta hydrolase [Chryseobacterium sp. CFBP8996]MDY0931058.1 alpha/beta hydrolase [Chryseobacterium sp. CFBP8996]